VGYRVTYRGFGPYLRSLIGEYLRLPRPLEGRGLAMTENLDGERLVDE